MPFIIDESSMEDLLLADLPPSSGRISPSDESVGGVNADFDFLGLLIDDNSIGCDDCEDLSAPSESASIILTTSTTPTEVQSFQPDFNMVPISPSSTSRLLNLASMVHMASKHSTSPDELTSDCQLKFPQYNSKKRKQSESTREALASVPSASTPPVVSQNRLTFMSLERFFESDSTDHLVSRIDEAISSVTDDEESTHRAISQQFDNCLPQGKKIKLLFDETITPQEDSHGELQYACAKLDESAALIERILANDPFAASKRGLISLTKLKYNYKTASVTSSLESCPYEYALNVAVQHRAAPLILKLLIDAFPAVLSLEDGNKESPLHVLMRYKAGDSETTKVMLSHRIDLVMSTDAKGNTPLHTLVMSAVPESLGLVRLLCHLHPAALEQRNRNGLTPVDLAQQRTSLCPPDIALYLRQRAENRFRARAATASMLLSD